MTTRLDVHVFHHFVSDDNDDEQVQAAFAHLKEELSSMGKLTNEAVDQLLTEAEDAKGKLATLVTFIKGVPALVAAAVADALAAANVDDATAASHIDSAREEFSSAVDEAIGATDVNPAPGDEDLPPVGEIVPDASGGDTSTTDSSAGADTSSGTVEEGGIAGDAGSAVEPGSGSDTSGTGSTDDSASGLGDSSDASAGGGEDTAVDTGTADAGSADSGAADAGAGPTPDTGSGADDDADGLGSST